MAQMIHTVTIIFDDNIVSVTHDDLTWTSGEEKRLDSLGKEGVFNVALRDGYILDTVLLDNTIDVSLVSKTDSSFVIDVTGEVTVTITLTSKKNTPGVRFLKHNGLLVNRSGKIVSNKKVPSGETWVLNEEPHFSPFINNDPSGKTHVEFEVNCSVNSVSYSFIEFQSELVPMHTDAVSIIVKNTLTDRNNIYYSGSWVDETYRTIIFNTAPTGDLLTWLQANGTKNEVRTKHTLAIVDQYTYDEAIIVNGNKITSPYTLQNGDIIKVPTTTKMTINGTSYNTGNESVLNISNKDIVITRNGPEKEYETVPYITINYTADR